MDMNSMSPILNRLKPEEKDILSDLLSIALKDGSGVNLEVLQGLYSSDYEEIPVSIDKFISDPLYMGKVYDGGKLIYPYWKTFLHNVFHSNPEKKFEIGLTGAIGTGKSTVASVLMSYLIYRTMCLKDPRTFYRITGNSPIVFAVMNLTVDLAYQGLYTLIVESIRNSPWFQERVTIRGKYDYSIEFGKGLSLIAGSQTTHVIGKNVIGACLTGDTVVVTTSGCYRIDELVGTTQEFYVRDRSGSLIMEKSEVIKTKETTTLVEIELENGSTIRCTPDHRFLLKTGVYKEAQYLTEDDELEEVIV